MSRVEPGQRAYLTVSRETPMGYMLDSEDGEILLHKNETTQELAEQEEVEVFVYLDNQSRLTATMHMPVVEEGTYAWVEVVDVNDDLGVFVDIGMSKDMLIGSTDLPALESLWPDVGNKLYCTMKISKHGKIYGKVATDDVMKAMAKPAPSHLFNREVTGRIYRVLRVGSFIMTEEGYVGFIHESERKEEPKIGALVTGRVVNVKEDGTLNVSLLPRKQESMDEDAQVLYDYMESRGGVMPFWDKSYPEDIRTRFNMSKAAFKRALGKLMKEDKVYQEEGWTYFKKDK
ncbi:S1-like domain-containing RNA-binding protein [Priestia flexa]|jgi:uncharacterized protein|uniref:S1 motif domain-containing protein n=1 Tax=Priestia flexa TaxID=86664 RepID=A0A8I1MFC8_9BACI|nr:S1-like domain-containing RNA-binding protein [Priestia flexa]MBN8251189.1 hypothetical protein [Priestia flexa]RIV08294.1 hypothetical protein D1859_13495 [Priestia flexa]UIR30628.1 S1-like domain-containing RNA-binding protein [Priestia flexa]